MLQRRPRPEASLLHHPLRHPVVSMATSAEDEAAASELIDLSADSSALEPAAPNDAEPAAPNDAAAEPGDAAAAEPTSEELAETVREFYWRRLNTGLKFLSGNTDDDCPPRERFDAITRFMVFIRKEHGIELIPMSLLMGFWIWMGMRGEKLAAEIESNGYHTSKIAVMPSDDELVQAMLNDRERKLMEPIGRALFYARTKCLACSFGERMGRTLLHTILIHEYDEEKVVWLSGQAEPKLMRKHMRRTKLLRFAEWSREGLEDWERSADILAIAHIKFMGALELRQNHMQIQRANKRIASSIVALTKSDIDLERVALLTMPMFPERAPKAAPDSDDSDSGEPPADELEAIMSSSTEQFRPEVNDPSFRVGAMVFDVFGTLRVGSLLLSGEWWPRHYDEVEASMCLDDDLVQRAFLVTMLSLLNAVVWRDFLTALCASSAVWDRTAAMYDQIKAFFKTWSALEGCPPSAQRVAHELAPRYLQNHKIDIEPHDAEHLAQMADGERLLWVGAHALQIVLMLSKKTLTDIMAENNIPGSYAAWSEYTERCGPTIRRFLDVLYAAETEALRAQILIKAEELKQLTAEEEELKLQVTEEEEQQQQQQRDQQPDDQSAPTSEDVGTSADAIEQQQQQQQPPEPERDAAE